MNDPPLFTLPPSPHSQRWWCPRCNASYTSPLPLDHPPAHWCRPPTGRSGMRNFELTPAEAR